MSGAKNGLPDHMPSAPRASLGSDADAPNPLMPNPLMPGLRMRHDGFTVERTRIFLATLGQAGCVRDACRVAGVTSTNAYRLKARFPLFAAEWAKALARAQKGLHAVAWQRAVEGKETIIMRHGKEVERRITPDSSILALLLKHGQMEGGIAGAEIAEQFAGADDILTRAEFDDGWRFSDDGGKYNKAEVEEMRAELIRRLDLMRSRMAAQDASEARGGAQGEGAIAEK